MTDPTPDPLTLGLERLTVSRLGTLAAREADRDLLAIHTLVAEVERLRAATVRPDLEALARAIYAQEAQPIFDEVSEQMVGYRPWGWLTEEHRGHYLSRAGELIDLFHGRTEAEVKAEAWDAAVSEVFACGYLHDPARADMLARNPYRKETGHG